MVTRFGFFFEVLTGFVFQEWLPLLAEISELVPTTVYYKVFSVCSGGMIFVVFSKLSTNFLGKLASVRELRVASECCFFFVLPEFYLTFDE